MRFWTNKNHKFHSRRHSQNYFQYMWQCCHTSSKWDTASTCVLILIIYLHFQWHFPVSKYILRIHLTLHQIKFKNLHQLWTHRSLSLKIWESTSWQLKNSLKTNYQGKPQTVWTCLSDHLPLFRNSFGNTRYETSSRFLRISLSTWF
jgi:hypothetical protein